MNYLDYATTTLLSGNEVITKWLLLIPSSVYRIGREKRDKEAKKSNVCFSCQNYKHLQTMPLSLSSGSEGSSNLVFSIREHFAKEKGRSLFQQ